ncbi:MAG: hypothetical protein IPN85_09185 [Flavobacteriales bacterium]|nr:hypothetical protein [Flavobacteriales bacterium]MBL0035693.1 hypothetical protein [Flavobacteriales bacterium]
MATSSNKSNMDKTFEALLSADDARILKALATVDERGDARSIMPLLNALAKTSEQKVQQRITEMLYQVKVSGAVEELMKALQDPALRSVRRTILATFWNAGLDVRDQVDALVAVAVEGDAEECFECLTVLENNEFLNDKGVLAGIKRLNAAIASNTDEYKGILLGSLLVELKARVGKD